MSLQKHFSVAVRHLAIAETVECNPLRLYNGSTSVKGIISTESSLSYL